MNDANSQKQANEFANKIGYDFAEYIKDWKGVKVYYCDDNYEENEPHIVGMIQLILVFKTKIRTATQKETADILKSID